MHGRLVLSLACAALAACAAPDARMGLTGVRFAPVSLPQGVARSNADLAEDFLDLTFGLESGEPLDGLLRYETPVRVYLDPAGGLGAYRRDLAELLVRLRGEAEIDIAETRDPARAQIRIEAVQSAELARMFPDAACLLVPGAEDWRAFSAAREADRPRWADQRELRVATIFLPTDTTAQDVRDCLHEELTQALGPANDLFRLPDSIWNDDNIHGIATPFDMLMLRVLYRPELASGMSRAEVSRRLPPLLDRLNPRGRALPRQRRHPESRAWADAMRAALSRDATRAERLGAARVAARIAAEMRPPDHRLAASLLALGRAELRSDPLAAARDFARAYNLLAARRDPDDIRLAQAAAHVAALAIATGQFETALDIVARHMPGALQGRDAILVSGLLAIEAQALQGLDRPAEARAARLDSLRWARYGFGDSDGALAREQAALARLDAQ